MSRIRTVKPDFWRSPKVTKVGRDARLCFIGLLNEADDEGRMRYSVKRLSGVLFGDDEDVTPAMFDDWISELEAARLVYRYSMDGDRLLLIPGFRDHQVVNHPSPSTLPGPLPEDYRSDTGRLLPGKERKGKERKGESGYQDGGSPQDPAPEASARSLKRATVPPDDFAIDDDLRDWAGRTVPGVNLDAETGAWVDWCQANGRSYKDHRAGWRTWMRRAKPSNGNGRLEKKEPVCPEHGPGKCFHIQGQGWAHPEYVA